MSATKDSTPTQPVVRRSKTMPTDSPTAKFLYTILKQLDLKGIDWSLVASQLEISNGHAARMRYHRFKNQMEGTTSTPRKRAANRPTTKSYTAGGSGKGSSCFSKEISPQPMQMIKTERTDSLNGFCESKPYIKNEIEQYPQHVPSLADIPQFISSQSMPPSASLSRSPLPAPIPYRQVNLGSEFGMFSGPSMPMHAPALMGMGYGQGRCSPVAWKPVKIEEEEEDSIFGKQGTDMNTVKEEAVQEPVKSVE
ncbi:hypothetical protein BJY01DRAFT_244503 [Aspergillus pseudoustus]|uniref:Myb-like DNA-binding domain-containing protein n=1 Tax=Aspergillus pseudoustus TaxID=1810923 RepID=A0ABR4KJP1_9EURO